MVFTPLGAPLPDLIASGFASPVTSWGHAVTVTVNVNNIGTSTAVEPLNLAPGSPSAADAPASQLGVFMTRRPRFNPNTATFIDAVDLPTVPQNSQIQVTSTFNMPNRPFGFPGDGGRIYLWYVPNYLNTFPESDLTNNVSNPSRVAIQAPFPELVTVGLGVPPVMQPGDTIQPNIRIANLGPADTDLQGPLTVALVASVTPTFGPGSSIVGEYTVANVPGASQIATKSFVAGDQNLIPQANIVTISGAPVTLPTSPGRYFLGVVIDPNHTIKQLHVIGRTGRNPFEFAQRVGPPIRGLPPAGLGTSGVLVPNPPFPFPVTGIPVGSNPNPGTTGSSGGTTGVFNPPPITFAQNAGAIGSGAHLVTTLFASPTRHTLRG